MHVEPSCTNTRVTSSGNSQRPSQLWRGQRCLLGDLQIKKWLQCGQCSKCSHGVRTPALRMVAFRFGVRTRFWTVLPGSGPPQTSDRTDGLVQPQPPNSGPNPGPVWEGSGPDQSSEPNRGNTRNDVPVVLYIRQQNRRRGRLVHH